MLNIFEGYSDLKGENNNFTEPGVNFRKALNIKCIYATINTLVLFNHLRIVGIKISLRLFPVSYLATQVA